MEPGLRDGQVVFVDKRAYLSGPPNDGDIVVAHHPDADVEIIKRVEFVDEGVYLRSDNHSESDAQDSRSFGMVGLEQHTPYGDATTVPHQRFLKVTQCAPSRFVSSTNTPLPPVALTAKLCVVAIYRPPASATTS